MLTSLIVQNPSTRLDKLHTIIISQNYADCKLLKICVVIITQGGGVAAPVGGQIFSEILPYLEVNQGNQDEIENVEEIEVPNIVGMSIKEAEKLLKESKLEISIENESEELDKENTVIKEQMPSSGIKINSGNKVYVKY